MTKYSLSIHFSADDVREINLIGQHVTILKKVEDDSINHINWISFKPYENNQITWSEQYGIYASSILTESGATIHKSSMVNPASVNQLYVFEEGTFDPPKSGERGSYQIKNEAQPYQTLTFGLCQALTANGKHFEANALNAVSVLPQECAYFIPKEKVRVFLHQKLDNGAVITDINSEFIDVDLTTIHDQGIQYSQGLFIRT